MKKQTKNVILLLPTFNRVFHNIFLLLSLLDDFYNKPWGLKHWLEHSLQPIPDNAIIALLDPDMIFLRPITPYIASKPYLINKRIPKVEIVERIVEGHPVAQTYGLGAPWTNDNHKHFKRGRICGEGASSISS
jgi:hypothetical protein